MLSRYARSCFLKKCGGQLSAHTETNACACVMFVQGGKFRRQRDRPGTSQHRVYSKWTFSSRGMSARVIYLLYFYMSCMLAHRESASVRCRVVRSSADTGLCTDSGYCAALDLHTLGWALVQGTVQSQTCIHWAGQWCRALCSPRPAYTGLGSGAGHCTVPDLHTLGWAVVQGTVQSQTCIHWAGQWCRALCSPRPAYTGLCTGAGYCCVRDVIRRACAPGLVAGFACLLCWTRSENVSSLFLVFLFLDYYNNCTNLSNAVCGPLGPDITDIVQSQTCKHWAVHLCRVLTYSRARISFTIALQLYCKIIIILY